MVTHQHFTVSDSHALLAQQVVERCPAEMWRCWPELGWTEWHKAEQFHPDSAYVRFPATKTNGALPCAVMPPHTITLPPPNDWRWMTQTSTYRSPTWR
jgi:hypothetical protein